MSFEACNTWRGKTRRPFCSVVAFVVVTVFALTPLAHADTRSTERAFATRVGTTVGKLREDFAAVGMLRCGSYVGTASLIGDHRTIVTAAHTFRYSAHELRKQICKKRSGATFRHFRCKGRIRSGLQADAEVGFALGVKRWRRDLYHRSGARRKRPSACTFTIWPKTGRNRLRRKTYTIDPKSVTFPPPLESQDVLELLRKDWAIARLTRKVDGVTPFLIPEREREEIGTKRLLQLIEDGAWEEVSAPVTAVSIKFARRGRAQKRFETCNVNSAIRNRYRSGSLFFSNCFAEPGTSGSLVLQPVNMLDGIAIKRGYVARGIIATVSRLATPGSTRKTVGLTGGIMVERELADALRKIISDANPVIPLPVVHPDSARRQAAVGQ
ncbi:MAG: hypothetical protein AAGJ70_04120 [Pseudomonadota bacterium]